MFLTAANLLHYLTERGFADMKSAVDGGFLVRPAGRRNRNFRVSAGGRDYFVKQARNWNYPGRSSVEREARFYRFSQTAPCPVAHCHSWDPANSTLILEWLGGCTPLCDAPDPFSSALARRVGMVTGEFHRTMRDARPAFPSEVSSFTLHLSEDLSDPDLSDGQRELLRAIHRHADFARELNRLREEWRRDTVIHADLKLDHCLVSADGEQVRLTDWEFIGEGDACEDVGGMLQSWCLFWARWPDEYTINNVRPALRAFLEGWASAYGADADEIATRAIRFAGARMLQSAFELLERVDSMTAEAVRVTQASLNILTRPGWATERLLGERAQCVRS